MAVPFALGYSWMKGMDSTNLVSIFIRDIHNCSQHQVIAKVLSELGYLKRAEGKIALGAAVLHDILGLILTAVLGLTSTLGWMPSISLKICCRVSTSW